MKKKINIKKLEEKYNIIESNNNIEKQTINTKLLLALKTFGLVLLLLIGPSLFASIFGDNINNFSLIGKVIISLISNLIILAILIFIYKDTLIKDFKNFFNKNISENLELSFKYWLLGFGIMIVSNLILTIITNGGIAGNEESVRKLIDIAPLYMLFDVAIYAPITEELIFRKSIRDFISNKFIYCLVSGLIFGGLHVISAIDTPIDALYIIPYSALGISFAALYTKSNNIFSSMSMHALHNTIAILIYLF